MKEDEVIKLGLFFVVAVVVGYFAIVTGIVSGF
jgi:hypothetical protein